jgi:hypothetical protein
MRMLSGTAEIFNGRAAVPSRPNDMAWSSLSSNESMNWKAVDGDMQSK